MIIYYFFVYLLATIIMIKALENNREITLRKTTNESLYAKFVILNYTKFS